ncbi:MAG TPA: hypothetical protein VFL59_02990 [Candidatus Nanopelagicales bacterium]|nr:hypothetical protein [Candidatus Nanopelagicales bacterium]
MRSTVVVRYTLRPEAMAEHVRLIEAVMAQLRRERLTNLDYQVLRLADGVTFLHVSTSDTPDGTSPLGGLSAFRDFQADLASRVATPPEPTSADQIGHYAGLSAPPA